MEHATIQRWVYKFMPEMEIHMLKKNQLNRVSKREILEVKSHPAARPAIPGIKIIFVFVTPKVHKVYIGSMALIIIVALVYFVYNGFTYYNTSLEERFYHPDYDLLKPIVIKLVKNEISITAELTGCKPCKIYLNTGMLRICPLPP